MSLSVAGMLQAGETPNLEAALVKDLGNGFEAGPGARARIGPAALRQGRGAARSGAFRAVLHLAVLDLRGGTREILRGIIARGLGLR